MGPGGALIQEFDARAGIDGELDSRRSSIVAADFWLRWRVVWQRDRLASQLRTGSAKQRLRAARLLRFGRDEWAQPLLREALGDRWALVRWTAAQALAGRQWGNATPLQGLQSQDPIVQAAEADALGPASDEESVDALSCLLDAPDVSVRQAAVEAVGRAGGPSQLSSLISVMRNPDEETCVRRAAIRAMCDMRMEEGTTAHEQVADAMQVCLHESSPVIRSAATWAVGRLRLTACASSLDGALFDSDAVVRWQAAGAVARVGTSTALPALRDLLDDDERVFGRMISGRARAALARIALRQGWERIKGWAKAIGEISSRAISHVRSFCEGKRGR